MELWQQLKLEQWFQPLRSETWKLEAKTHVWPMCLQDFLGESMQILSGPFLDDDWALQFDWRGVKAPILGNMVGTAGHMLN